MSLLRLDIGSSGQQSLAGFSGSSQDGSPTNAGGSWTNGQADERRQQTKFQPQPS